MRPAHFTSIHRRLSLSTTLLLATAIVAAMGSAYVQVRHAAVSAEHERLERVSQQVADLLHASMANLKGVMWRDAQKPALRQFLLSPDSRNTSAALAALATMRGVSTQIVDVRLWDGSGARKLSVGGDGLIVPPSIRDELRVPLARGDSAVVGSLHLVGDAVVWVVAAPVVEQGRTIGYLVERGRPAGSPRAARALADLIGHGTAVYIGNARGDVWTDFWTRVDPPPARTATPGEVLEYERPGAARGASYAVERAVPGTPWLLVVESPRDLVLAPATAFVRNAALFGLVLFLLAMAWRVAQSQRRLRRELASMENQHRVLVDGIEDYAIFMLDPAGTVVSWNRGAERINGYRSEEIIGQHFSRFYSGADVAARKPSRELEVARADGRCEDEGWRVCRDGSSIWASVVITALHDDRGSLVGFAKVMRDISEKRRVAEAQEAHTRALQEAYTDLERHRHELKMANEDLESFTYSVSHDLRAPIRQIEGFSTILGEHLAGNVDAEAEQYLRRIREGSQQMGRLVDDLLHLAQLGRRPATPHQIPLDSLVGNVLAKLRAEVADRDIEWRFTPLPAVACDRGLMEVAFTNLLANAVKYTRRREKAVIEIGQTVRDGRPVLYVRDNGVGFDMKYADKLFGVFQRLHRAEEFEGTGVGLSIVHRIIRMHDGSIWAEGQPDAGATFFFTLGGDAASPAIETE
jgi:PAS domain S-box-containing protein